MIANVRVFLEREAIAPIAKVICFDASYNREFTCENMIRINNIDMIDTIIEELSGNVLGS